jgi:transposase-like protein
MDKKVCWINALEKIKPNVYDTWRTDELFVKVKANMKYLYALMDDETKVLECSTRLIHLLFREGN